MEELQMFTRSWFCLALGEPALVDLNPSPLMRPNSEPFTILAFIGLRLSLGDPSAAIVRRAPAGNEFHSDPALSTRSHRSVTISQRAVLTAVRAVTHPQTSAKVSGQRITSILTIFDHLLSRMPKRKKRASVSSSSEAKSVPPNRPRLDPQERLLSRFHEPLVLLYTLGRTRGERTSVAMPAREHLAHLPLDDIRRMFLNELAYVCDYDKGGETVTALGLQHTPQGYIFWLASNAGLKTKVIEFLDSLLNRVLHTGAATDVPQLVAEVASECITFAGSRIKKYKSHLRPLLRRCTSHLEAQEPVGKLKPYI